VADLYRVVLSGYRPTHGGVIHLSLELRQGVVTHAICVRTCWEHRGRGRPLPRCAPTVASGEHPRLSSLLVVRNLYALVFCLQCGPLANSEAVVGISATARQDDDVEDDEEGDPDLWHGNKRRALWKTTCTRAALDPRSSPAERALYAALAPSIQTSGILKSACRTWEDALWATISVLCEERQSEALARLGGGFWEPSGRELGEDVEGEAAEEEEEAWRADVEQELQALATVQVQEGLGADDPFHISQLHIILDRTDALLDDFASRLRDGAYDPESSECAFPFMLNPHTLSSLTISLTGTQP
jgi:hypothetical protein